MSTEIKYHELEQISRLSVVYLRNALNNPRWTDGLDDHIKGCDVLRALPKINVPSEVVAKGSDEATLEWGEGVGLPLWKIDDATRDTCRKALKFAFDNKMLPVNEHSLALIHLFSLRIK
jgi:hypothetical protein